MIGSVLELIGILPLVCCLIFDEILLLYPDAVLPGKGIT